MEKENVKFIRLESSANQEKVGDINRSLHLNDNCAKNNCFHQNHSEQIQDLCKWKPHYIVLFLKLQRIKLWF